MELYFRVTLSCLCKWMFSALLSHGATEIDKNRYRETRECDNNTKQCYCEFFLKVWISFCKSQGKIQCWGKSPKRKFSSHVRQRRHFPQRLRPKFLWCLWQPLTQQLPAEDLGKVQERVKRIYVRKHLPLNKILGCDNPKMQFSKVPSLDPRNNFRKGKVSELRSRCWHSCL